jgi:two-component system, NarL family, response regulator DesR
MNTDPQSAGNAMNETRPRLLIADDDQIVSATLTAQLRAEFEVVGAAADGDRAIELAQAVQPDVALVDVQMPGGGGLHTTRGITEVSPQTAIVILSVDESDQSVIEFMNAGAMTYLRKGTPAAEIAQRLHRSIAAHKTLDDC